MDIVRLLVFATDRLDDDGTRKETRGMLPEMGWVSGVLARAPDIIGRDNERSIVVWLDRSIPRISCSPRLVVSITVREVITVVRTERGVVLRSSASIRTKEFDDVLPVLA
jgi:hypothetical protein